MGCFYSSIDGHSALFSELSAILLGIEIARSMKWRRLWIESDSQVSISIVNQKSDNIPWRLKTRWVNCLAILNQMEFQCSHVYREGNLVADALWRKGLGEKEFYWGDSVIPDLQVLVDK